MVAVLADVRDDLQELAATSPARQAGLLEAHARLLTFVRGYAFGPDGAGEAGWSPAGPAERIARLAPADRKGEGRRAPGSPSRVRGGSCRCATCRPRVTFAPRRWRTSPPFDGLDRELATGADLDHPLFPVVWPAGG